MVGNVRRKPRPAPKPAPKPVPRKSANRKRDKFYDALDTAPWLQDEDIFYDAVDTPPIPAPRKKKGGSINSGVLPYLRL